MSEAVEEEPRYGCPNCLSVFRLGFSRCPIDGNVLQKLVEDPLIGLIIAERYLIEDCIGEGGMGRVYRARHQRVSRQFAIKVLFGDLSTDPKMRERFAREAEAASRLSHANVISVMDFGETQEGLLYLAMDFVEGPELAQVIEDEGPFTSERVTSITKQLCLGLRHAHEEGLIHRDFKGENVILSRRGDLGVPKIVGFGIAVMLEDADSRLTTQGVIIGTPMCMSPEQATGQELDARSDLFSLGVLMYEMLAGVKPFVGDPMAVARQNLAADLPPIYERVPGLEVDPTLERIARKLMEKLPEDRFQSAQEALAALDEQETLPSSPPPVEFTRESARSRRPLTVLGVSALLLLGIVGSGLLLLRDDTQTDASQTVDASLAIAHAIPQSSDGSSMTFVTPGSPAIALDAAASGAAIDARGPTLRSRDQASGATIDARVPTLLTQDRHLASGKRVARADPAGAPTANTALPQPSDGGPTAQKQPKLPSKETKKPPTSTALTSLYVSVGEAIQRLQGTRPEKVSIYQKQYAAIPFNDALRVPTMRSEVESKLRRLSADIEKERNR